MKKRTVYPEGQTVRFLVFETACSRLRGGGDPKRLTRLGTDIPG